MGGKDNLAGIDFQISYGVFRLLDLLAKRTPFVAVQFEEPNDEGQDLAIHYSDSGTEIIQVKKRNEAYLWTPSSIRPSIESFFLNKKYGQRYVFFSDGSLNADLIAIRSAIEDNTLYKLHDHHLKSLCPNINSRELREFLQDISFRTRQYVSNNPSKPGDALRTECLHLLARAPFTPLIDTEQIYERLWSIVFNASKEARPLTYDEISNLLDIRELIPRPSGLPVLAPDAIERSSDTKSILRALKHAPNLFVYGISGTGKTTIIAQALSARTEPVFWSTISPATTSGMIRQSLTIFLECMNLNSASEILRRSNVTDIEAIAAVITSEKLICVFDAVEKATPQISDFFQELSIISGRSRCANLIFAGQELPTWQAVTATQPSSSMFSIHITGLGYDEFTAYLTPITLRVSKEHLELFYKETGGLPIAASLLKTSISRANDDDELAEIFMQKAESIQKFLFSKVFSKLIEDERDFIEVASVFDGVFTVDEANIILDRPLKSVSMVRSLTPSGIVTELTNGFQIHDSIRPLAYGMLLPSTAGIYHRKLELYYRQQIEEDGNLFELIHKWGRHIDLIDDLKNPYMKKISDLDPESLFCLWSIYQTGFPYCFSEEKMIEKFDCITQLMKTDLIKFDANYNSKQRVFELDRPPSLLTLATDDNWSTNFLWFAAQRATPANHMGYIKVTQPNFAWALQRHTVCPWEHCIEYEPLMPYDQAGPSVKIWFEQALIEGDFAFRGQSTNAETLQRLDDLVRLGDTIPGDERLYEVVGACPIFGHCCPGGAAQADICRSREKRYEASDQTTDEVEDGVNYPPSSAPR